MLVNGHTAGAAVQPVQPTGVCPDPQDAVAILVNRSDIVITQDRQVTRLYAMLLLGPFGSLLEVSEAAGSFIYFANSALRGDPYNP